MTRVEHARDGENEGVRYTGPDHTAPMTWLRCIVEGCAVRLDPWEHRTRCVEHQAERDAQIARARAIVQANREAGEAERYERLMAG